MDGLIGSWIASPSGVKAWSRCLPGLGRLHNRAPLTDLTRVRRLGVLRADGVGDLVLTTGMLRELRRQLPQARITLICQAAWAPWMRTCPWVDEVVDVAITCPGWRRGPRRALELWRFVRRVWPLRLEVLLQPGTAYWYVPSRALAWFSGAPVRLCWEDPDVGVDTGGGLHTRTLPYPNSWHEADKCFHMLEATGLEAEGRRLEPFWNEEDGRQGRETAREAKGARPKLVALGLAGSESARRWPRERYLEVVRELTARQDAAFLALGGADVAGNCRWLAQQAPDRIHEARLSLGAVWAAIAGCDLYVGHDTGLMHMAAAARVPVVSVIGVADSARPGTRGDPSHTGPYDTPSRVVRPTAGSAANPATPTGRVPAEAVASAALQLLCEPPGQ